MSLSQRYNDLSTPEKRVFWTSLCLSVILGLFGLSVWNDLLHSKDTVQLIVNSIGPILSVIAFVSTILIFTGRIKRGIWLLYISVTTLALIVPFLVSDFGYPIAVLLIAVTVFIPAQALPENQARIATIIGVTCGAFIIAIDSFFEVFVPAPRFAADGSDISAAQISAIFIGGFVIGNIILQYGKFKLNTKLLILTLGIGIASTVGIATALNFTVKSTLTRQTKEKLTTAAQSTSNQIDSIINFNVAFLKSQTQVRDVITYLELSPSNRAGSEEERRVRIILNNYAQQNPGIVGSYALLDLRGVDVLDTYTKDVGLNKSDRDYFKAPLKSGGIFISPVRYSPTSDDYGFYISAPVKNANSFTIGVLRLRLQTTSFTDILNSNIESAGQGSYPLLLDDFNIIIGNIKDKRLNSLTIFPLSTAQNDLLVSENRILANPSVSLNLADLDNKLKQRFTTPYFSSREENQNDLLFNNQDIEVSVVDLKSVPWKMLYIQPSRVAFAPIRQITQIATLFALLISIFVATISILVANSISSPVILLTQTAESLRRGDLETRVNITSQDEFKTLGEAFNLMATQLNQTLLSLERRVADRTNALEKQTSVLAERSAELEISNSKSERRALQLQAVADVSKSIASIQNIRELLPLITQVISEKFSFYHVGIFLIDVSSQYAVLSAANSIGGQKMLARGHRLKIGETGIVGNVTSTGRPKIAVDTGADATFFNNPDLPDTRSELALPLRLGNTIIGALDVQSTIPNAFTTDDVEILNILSQQVSIAIQNARLFEDTQRASTEMQILLNQYAREQWNKETKENSQLGYKFSGSFTEKLENPVTFSTDGSILNIPVQVRGHKIGSLGIRAPQGKKWNSDDVDIAKAIAERVAIAAENARLLNETQRQASKEQLIGTIATKISSSVNIRSILRTAVEELGHALPNSEVTIKFTENES